MTPDLDRDLDRLDRPDSKFTIDRLDQPDPGNPGKRWAFPPKRWAVTATRPDGTTLRLFLTEERGGARDISVHGIRPEEIQ